MNNQGYIEGWVKGDICLHCAILDPTKKLIVRTCNFRWTIFPVRTMSCSFKCDQVQENQAQHSEHNNWLHSFFVPKFILIQKQLLSLWWIVLFRTLSRLCILLSL